ncbi:C40 family peptidase [Pararhizobium gei]|uniref:C40 family peptidase n=1 Tax=Pararhizobium gei TaxID=1395951 RepID=UPI0023DA20DD|nr:NlpC/P60 family protein [Rhizobium gei]
MTHWTSAYIGIPFREHGRSSTGVDCWGLACVIYAGELGIQLPGYTEAYASVAEMAEIDAEIGGAADSPMWLEASRPQTFDIAVFRVGTLRRHLGIVVAPGMMIHAHDDCTKIEHYKAPKWEHRLTGIYRHVEMASRAAL